MYTVINNKRYLYNTEDNTIGVMVLNDYEWTVQAYSVKVGNRIIVEMDDTVSDYDEINSIIRDIYNNKIEMFDL